MISVKEIWDRLADYAKKHQSGMHTVANFNGKISEIQVELIVFLLPFMETNDRIRNMVSSFIRHRVGTTGPNGLIAKPSQDADGHDFLKALRLGITHGGKSFDAVPIRYNEIGLNERIPQRKSDLGKQKARYVTDRPNITLIPLQSGVSYDLDYIIYPSEARIAFGNFYDEDSDEYILLYDQGASLDLQWDRDAFNIILYMMLDKYGISAREQLIREYGKLGIDTVLAAPTTNVQ